VSLTEYAVFDWRVLFRFYDSSTEPNTAFKSNHNRLNGKNLRAIVAYLSVQTQHGPGTIG
jgi:hypothetical protein